MSAQFDLPRIDGANADERFAQIQSYLWQFVEKMNYILNYLDTDEAAGGSTVLQTASGGYSGIGGETDDSVRENGWLIRVGTGGFKEAYTTVDITGDDWGGTSGWPIHYKPLPSSFSEKKIVALNGTFFGNDYLGVVFLRSASVPNTLYFKLSGAYHVITKGKVFLYVACEA